MNFEKFFRVVSYAAVLCGFLSLWVSGTFGLLGTGLFLAVLVTGWFLEDSRWQISEKLGTTLIVLALPAYYFAWRYRLIHLYNDEAAVAGILARMILSLTAVKLLQKKSDRDWIFLYMMSFFEVLLAAGLSISALYLASFLAYLLVMVCAIIAFEIRKTSRSVERKIAGEEKPKPADEIGSKTIFPVRRLPSTATALIVFTILLATPLFFLLPRVGGAGFGGNQNGLATSSGFADTVKLGGIGRIQQNNEIVMRVKLEGNAESQQDLYFRGIALDTFDNRSWSKSKTSLKAPYVKGESDVIQVDYPANRENISIQTIYLEPLDTPVLFVLPRAVGVQGGFPIIYKDPYGGLSFSRGYERISYKVLSDRSLPPVSQLRADDQPYTADVWSFRTLPPLTDQRIVDLASQITARASNRYDKARAIESYLQNSFGYTLEQKAGGADPLADFLFNVREGHCEYFATAMAIMLRTQGIATRVVNGFHGGEYNDAADVTVVRQRNAHAWVEVYFPKEDAWITFDPTPFSEEEDAGAGTGITGKFNKYLEALETLWIQYFVAYDDQGQRSLARSVRSGLMDYQAAVASFSARVEAILSGLLADLRGDKGLRASAIAAAYTLGCLSGAVLIVLFLIWIYRRVRRLELGRRLRRRFLGEDDIVSVDFYDRMQRILSERGLSRETFQTPLEFAYSTGIDETVRITEKYNRVRFGKKGLTSEERATIESWLTDLKQRK